VQVLIVSWFHWPISIRVACLCGCVTCHIKVQDSASRPEARVAVCAKFSTVSFVGRMCNVSVLGFVFHATSRCEPRRFLLPGCNDYHSCLRSFGFCSRPRGWLFLVRLFLVLLFPVGQLVEQCLKTSHDRSIYVISSSVTFSHSTLYADNYTFEKDSRVC
jgi:hypothetical protein